MSNFNFELLVQLLLGLGPFLLLAAALFIRAVAITMEDSVYRATYRRYLKLGSFALLGIAIISTIFATFTVGPIGIIGFVVSGVLIVSIIQSEIQVAGVKNRTQQAELLWTLALAVRSGRPLNTEISNYASGATGKRRDRLNLFARRLGEGRPLTEIIVPYHLLPDSTLMQIHSGIFSDSLEKSLMQAAMRLTNELAEERETEFTGTGLIYPPALLFLSSIIVGFVMYYIIPKFKKIFDDFGTELPDWTVRLIQASDFIVNYWYAIGVPFLLAMPIVACTLVAQAEFYGWHNYWRMTFGYWFVRCHTPNLLRALSQSISNKISIAEALLHLSHHTHIYKLRMRLTQIFNSLESGKDNWTPFKKAGFLTAREIAILQAAERANNLPWALDMLATTIEQRQLFRIRSVLEIVQPICLIPLGLVVAFICISLFLPLVKLLYDLS